jgi:hypothetical protein
MDIETGNPPFYDNLQILKKYNEDLENKYKKSLREIYGLLRRINKQHVYNIVVEMNSNDISRMSNIKKELESLEV